MAILEIKYILQTIFFGNYWYAKIRRCIFHHPHLYIDINVLQCIEVVSFLLMFGKCLLQRDDPMSLATFYLGLVAIL